VAGRDRDEMGEAFERHEVAVVDERRDGFGQGDDFGHASPERCVRCANERAPSP
jgi:hypothetical protein